VRGLTAFKYARLLHALMAVATSHCRTFLCCIFGPNRYTQDELGMFLASNSSSRCTKPLRFLDPDTHNASVLKLLTDAFGIALATEEVRLDICPFMFLRSSQTAR
jgi:hypothetical protein